MYQTEPPLLFTGNANRPLSEAIAGYLNAQLGKANVSTFSDGEINVEIGENVRGRDTFIIQSTCYPVNRNPAPPGHGCAACDGCVARGPANASARRALPGGRRPAGAFWAAASRPSRGGRHFRFVGPTCSVAATMSSSQTVARSGRVATRFWRAWLPVTS